MGRHRQSSCVIFPGVEATNYSTIVSMSHTTRRGLQLHVMYKLNLLAKRTLPRWWATLGQAAFGKIIQGQLDLCESNLCASCHTKCGTYI